MCPAAVREVSDGGVHLSLDALGSHATCGASVRSLRKRGRHVQVGLMPPSLGHPPVPMSRVIAFELEIVGSHGIQAHAFDEVLGLVRSGTLRPDRLVTSRIGLAEAGTALEARGTGDDRGRRLTTKIVPRPHIEGRGRGRRSHSRR